MAQLCRLTLIALLWQALVFSIRCVPAFGDQYVQFTSPAVCTWSGQRSPQRVHHTAGSEPVCAPSLSALSVDVEIDDQAHSDA